MTERRSYISPHRDKAAAATRAAVLDHATYLFAEHGYARVTVADIAAATGVAVKTVYASVGNKAEILDRIVDNAVATSGYLQTVEQIRELRTLDEVLQALAHGTRVGNESHAAVLTAVRKALPVHESGEALWQRATSAYRQALHVVAAHLEALGQLPRWLDATQAADLLWLLFGPTSWHTLVAESGRTWAAAEAFLHRTAVAALTPSP
ncbi:MULTISPECIES: TetR/AcrR family transcriptional regulator [unclassified Micromonospora]|uniref:TetR/AcrR family transcriptional regulator n=1 Tax=unclassified Micromonospora TaxID=2617518 RepID=UPI002FEF5A5A